MAKSGEHRMLFDLRGRRKRMIQVVYAGLALFMALSLFTVVGPVNIGDLFGNGSGSTNTSSVFDDQVQRLEHQLKKNPNDPTLLTQLTRTSFNAGNAGIQRDPTSGQLVGIPQSAIDDFNKAGDAWQRYLKTNPSKQTLTPPSWRPSRCSTPPRRARQSNSHPTSRLLRRRRRCSPAQSRASTHT